MYTIMHWWMVSGVCTDKQREWMACYARMRQNNFNICTKVRNEMKGSVVDALAVCSVKETCREDVLRQLPNVQRRDVQDSWQEYKLIWYLSGSEKSCYVRHALEKGTCTLYPTIVAAIYKGPQQVGLTRCWPDVQRKAAWSGLSDSSR